MSRVPAPEIEAQVLQALMQVKSTDPDALPETEGVPTHDRELVENYLDKIIGSFLSRPT